MKTSLHQDSFLRAVRHFNRGEFYDAHEVWEDVWRETPPPDKKFLQGLIQVAVALHHHSTGNSAGARSLLPRACRNLQDCPEDFRGLDIAGLLQSLAAWQKALERETSVPPLPRV